MSELQQDYIDKLEGQVRELRQRVAELEQRYDELSIFSMDQYAEVLAQLAACKDELKAIGQAIDDPRTDMSMTMVEVIQDMKKQLTEEKQLRRDIEKFYAGAALDAKRYW